MSLQSRSLSGQPFAVEHHILLRTVARARQWEGNVWVPAKVVARLQLPLRPSTVAPLRLDGSNGVSCVYHSDQFTVPLSTLQATWDRFVAQQALSTVATASEEVDVPSDASSRVFPLSTNGERFDPETEQRMLQCSHRSPYWATAAEADYIFRSPFCEAYVADSTHAVVTNAFHLCQPVALYNVEGTADPSRFTSTTCCHYDPVNYEGRFYRPCVAVAMKAFAVRHGCLHERQWITERRAATLGLAVPRGIVPVSFYYEKPVCLVNVAVLRRSALIRGRVVNAPVSPHGAANEQTGEGEQEDALLLSSTYSRWASPRIPALSLPPVPSV